MDEAVLLDTVKKMAASGLSDQAIFNTLLDVGVTKQRALVLIDSVRSGLAPTPPKPKQPVVEEKPRQEDSDSGELQSLTENDSDLPSLEEDGKNDDLKSPIFNEEETHDKIAEKTAQKIKRQLEERDLVSTSTAVSWEEHGQKLDDMHDKVDKLHQKMDSLNQKSGASPDVSKKINSLSAQIKSLQSEIKSIQKSNAQTQALLKKLVSNQPTLPKKAVKLLKKKKK